MSDIAAFIRARLDEDERITRAATPGPWRVTEDDVPEWARETTALLIEAGARPDGHPIRVAGPGYEGGGIWGRADAEHVASHDPSRVLREVAAKRKVLKRHLPVEVLNHDGKRVVYVACSACLEATGRTYEDDPIATSANWPCPELTDMVSIWVDHPDFDPSWRTDG